MLVYHSTGPTSSSKLCPYQQNERSAHVEHALENEPQFPPTSSSVPKSSTLRIECGQLLIHRSCEKASLDIDIFGVPERVPEQRPGVEIMFSAQLNPSTLPYPIGEQNVLAFLK